MLLALGFGASARGSPWVPWSVALVFALHPVCVESVAWITELKNTLSGAFFLGALLAYARFETLATDSTTGPDSDSAVDSRRDWGFYACALAVFVGALLSKTVTATFPATVLVLCWWRGRRLTRRTVLPLVPFALLTPVAQAAPAVPGVGGQAAPAAQPAPVQANTAPAPSM